MQKLSMNKVLWEAMPTSIPKLLQELQETVE
jgi:hypothetical protein